MSVIVEGLLLMLVLLDIPLLGKLGVQCSVMKCSGTGVYVRLVVGVYSDEAEYCIMPWLYIHVLCSLLQCEVMSFRLMYGDGNVMEVPQNEHVT